jgi:dihydrodipicolinate synthase/N-acetylneuraminate lyase
MTGIYEAWKAGEYEKAKKLQFSILPAVRAMFSLTFPLGFKVAMETRGFAMGPPKQPLSDAEQSKFKTMKTGIEKIINAILKDLENIL